MSTEEKEKPVLWPPAYTIKRHPRARYVKLKASPLQGLEIVVPKRFNQKTIPDILETNKSWIEKRLREIEATIHLRASVELPASIYLRAIDETWSVEYMKTHHQNLRLITRPNREVVLIGNTDDKEKCKKRLVEWIKVQAEIHLCLYLEKLSELTNLSFKTVSIRDQRSRWGSCTSQKTITLNYKLLFLPKELAAHILIHELCHTVHLNHSDRFWKLVSSFDPQWKQHSTDVRVADKWMPIWLS